MGALEAVSKVIDAIDHATDSDPSTDPYVDLKEAALELVMPKLDSNSLIRYATSSIVEQIDKNLEEQREQKRLEQERLQQEQSNKIDSIKKPVIEQESELFNQQNQSRDSYSVTDYMEKSDAEARADMKSKSNL